MKVYSIQNKSQMPNKEKKSLNINKLADLKYKQIAL